MNYENIIETILKKKSLRVIRNRKSYKNKVFEVKISEQETLFIKFFSIKNNKIASNENLTIKMLKKFSQILPLPEVVEAGEFQNQSYIIEKKLGDFDIGDKTKNISNKSFTSL